MARNGVASLLYSFHHPVKMICCSQFVVRCILTAGLLSRSSPTGACFFRPRRISSLFLYINFLVLPFCHLQTGCQKGFSSQSIMKSLLDFHVEHTLIEKKIYLLIYMFIYLLFNIILLIHCMT